MHQTVLTITLATGNAHKVSELTALLQTHQRPDDPVQIQLALPDAQALAQLSQVPEDAETFMGNARQKALVLSQNTDSGYVLAEDSGLVIPALSGYAGMCDFPGVRSNRWLSQAQRKEILGLDGDQPVDQAQKNQAILTLMSDQADRRAHYCCAMVLVSGGQCVFEAEGQMPLLLIEPGEQPRGSAGFGYDPIMCPVGKSETVAEMSPHKKNALSHRFKAFLSVISYLKAAETAR